MRLLHFSLLLSVAACIHTPPETEAISSEKAATLLSQQVPILAPRYFPCEPDTGRPGIWVGPEAPRFTGARAFVTLEDSAQSERFILITAQYRNWNGTRILFAEGPAGGFDSEYREDKSLFLKRELLFYQTHLQHLPLDHAALNRQAHVEVREAKSHATPEEKELAALFPAGDHNTYRNAIREGVEESGVRAFIISDAELQKAGIQRKVQLLGLDETDREMIADYHIAFSCRGCLGKSSVLAPRTTPTEEIEYAEWIPASYFRYRSPGKLEIRTKAGAVLPIRPNDNWNERLGVLLGFTPAGAFSHDAYMNQK